MLSCGLVGTLDPITSGDAGYFFSRYNNLIKYDISSQGNCYLTQNNDRPSSRFSHGSEYVDVGLQTCKDKWTCR